MSDLLKDTLRRKQRRQSAIQLRRLSMPSPAADEAQITLAAEDLIQASRACYRIIFLLAAVRLGTTLIDDNIWSKLFDPNQPNLGWEDCVDIFDSTTWLVSGLSMWHCATLQERNKTIEKDEVQKLDDTTHFYSVMYWAWGIVALDLALVSLSIASALPTIGVEGAFHSELIGTEANLTTTVGTIIVVGFSIITTYCTRVAIAQDEEDNRRINQSQRDSKSRPQYKRMIEVGRRAYCSIVLCAGSNLLYAFMELLKWIVADRGTIVRGLMLFDVVDPFAETILIMKLSQAYLCLVPIHREWSKESYARDAQICINYFSEYSSFYQKRTDVLNGMVIAKLCECAAPYVIPHASVMLRNVAPTLYERLFG